MIVEILVKVLTFHQRGGDIPQEEVDDSNWYHRNYKPAEVEMLAVLKYFLGGR